MAVLAIRRSGRVGLSGARGLGDLRARILGGWIMTWLAAIAGLIGIIGWGIKIFYNNQQKKAGMTEAALVASQRESERAKRRQQIEAEIRKEGPDELERDLRS